MADPVATPAWTMLSSFLSEMEALDAVVHAPAAVEAETPGAAASGIPAQSDSKEKKRKRTGISSTERKKREKKQLLSSIDQLQSQLEQIRSRIREGRQRMEINHELDQENFRLRWAMRSERERASRLSRLLKRLRMRAKPDLVKHSRALDSSEQSARMIKLERRINARFQHIVHRWSQNTLPVVAGETFDTVPSPDGLGIEHRLVRVLPFDVKAIAEAVWSCGQLDMRKFYRMNQDTLALIEELEVCPPRQAPVSLQLQAVFRRFVFQNRSIFMWEADCEWSSPSGEQRSAMVESGWSMIDSLCVGAHSPVSAVQMFSPAAASIEPCDQWLQLLVESKIISRPGLPSYHKLEAERFQRVENQLIDEAISALAVTRSVAPTLGI